MDLTKTHNDCSVPFKARIMSGKAGLKTEILWTIKWATTPYIKSWQLRSHIYFPLHVFLTLLNTRLKSFTDQSPEVGSSKLGLLQFYLHPPFPVPGIDRVDNLWWYIVPFQQENLFIYIRNGTAFTFGNLNTEHENSQKFLLSRSLQQLYQTQRFPKGEWIKASGNLHCLSQGIK